LIINLAALVLGWAALRAYGGTWVFVGLRGLVRGREQPRPEKPIQLGVLGWVRHPLYGTAIVILWAHDLNAANLVTSAVLTVYILVGTILEERRLEQEWGPDWLVYRSRVSAFLPIKRIKAVLLKKR
jgi:protein-S-isoprenylcysteine O-methyltransferase Ste14